MPPCRRSETISYRPTRVPAGTDPLALMPLITPQRPKGWQAWNRPFRVKLPPHIDPGGSPSMARIVKAGLIQTSLAVPTSESLDRIREAQIERNLKFIDEAGAQGVQIICMQEIFTGPYFCAEQSTRWYDAVEHIPDGPTT